MTNSNTPVKIDEKLLLEIISSDKKNLSVFEKLEDDELLQVLKIGLESNQRFKGALAGNILSLLGLLEKRGQIKRLFANSDLFSRLLSKINNDQIAKLIYPGLIEYLEGGFFFPAGFSSEQIKFLIEYQGEKFSLGRLILYYKLRDVDKSAAKKFRQEYDLDYLRNSIVDFEKMQLEANSLREQLSGKDREIQDLDRYLVASRKESEEARNILGDLKNKYDNLFTQKKEVDQENKDLKAKSVEFREKVDSLNNLLNDFKEKYDYIYSQKDVLVEENKILKKQIAEKASVSEKKLFEQIESLKEENQKYKGKVLGFENLVSESNQKIEKLQNEKKQLEDYIRELSKRRFDSPPVEDVKKLEEENNTLRMENKNLRKENQRLQGVTGAPEWLWYLIPLSLGLTVLIFAFALFPSQIASLLSDLLTFPFRRH